MSRRKHFMNEIREEFSDLFYKKNIISNNNKRLNDFTFNLKLGSSYLYLLNHSTYEIRDVEPTIFLKIYLIKMNK